MKLNNGPSGTSGSFMQLSNLGTEGNKERCDLSDLCAILGFALDSCNLCHGGVILRIAAVRAPRADACALFVGLNQKSFLGLVIGDGYPLKTRNYAPKCAV
jgi:hypothetical protein